MVRAASWKKVWSGKALLKQLLLWRGESHVGTSDASVVLFLLGKMQTGKDKCEGPGEERRTQSHWDQETPSEGTTLHIQEGVNQAGGWAWLDERRENSSPQVPMCYQGWDLDAWARLPELKSNLSLLTRSRNSNSLKLSVPLLSSSVKWE